MYKYFRESDFEWDVPSTPLFFVKNFNLNSKYIQKRSKMISRSFLNFNLSKNILENNEYNHDDRDNAIDVTYSKKPDRGGTLNAMSTSTTTQPFTITRALKPIINNTVRPIWK